jgi:Xaa-Pro aminopeptidase
MGSPSESGHPEKEKKHASIYSSRWERLRGILDRHNLDGVWIFSYENRRYLTGFTGTNGQVFLTRDRLFFLTDGRYTTQAELEAVFDDLIIYHQLEDPFGKLSRRLRVGVEGSGISFFEGKKLFTSLGVEPYDLSADLRAFRASKDPYEIRCIEKAIRIAESAFESLEPSILTFSGRRESELALALEFSIRQRGSKVLPFPIIIASGERSALPHGIASDRTIQQGDPITLDFGGEWEGYFSDMTISGAFGADLSWLEELIGILRRAQDEAIKSIADGVPAKEVDARARAVIASYRYGDFFPHSLGHGVGLMIHEPPSLSSQSDEILSAGMVVTVEPGIYIPGRGGARVEEMVLVTEGGALPLTKLPKNYRIFR